MGSKARRRLSWLLSIVGIVGVCLAAMQVPLGAALLGPLPSWFPAALLLLAGSPVTAWMTIATLAVAAALLIVTGGRSNYIGAAIAGIGVLGYVGASTVGATTLAAYQFRTGSNQAYYAVALALIVLAAAVSVIALIAGNRIRSEYAASAETVLGGV